MKRASVKPSRHFANSAEFVAYVAGPEYRVINGQLFRVIGGTPELPSLVAVSPHPTRRPWSSLDWLCFGIVVGLWLALLLRRFSRTQEPSE